MGRTGWRIVMGGAAVAVAAALWAGEPAAQGGEVVVYSARSHYGQEPAIDAFTKKTGIQVKSFGGDSNQLFERLRAEGDKSPPTC